MSDTPRTEGRAFWARTIGPLPAMPKPEFKNEIVHETDDCGHPCVAWKVVTVEVARQLELELAAANARAEAAEKERDLAKHQRSEDEAHITAEMADLYATLLSQEQRLHEVAEAANAVVERWDTPLWKDVEPTANCINRLRHSLVWQEAKLKEGK